MVFSLCSHNLCALSYMHTCIHTTLDHATMQGNYVMFHYIKGTPYTTNDQGDARRLTSWEQIDNGDQYTATRKFLIAVPVVL